MQFLLAGCSIIFTTFPVITGLCMMKARIMWLEVGDPRLAQSSSSHPGAALVLATIMSDSENHYS